MMVDLPVVGLRDGWWVPLRLGAVSFGGLGPATALMYREPVVRRGCLTSADVRDALTYTKPLPDSTVVQAVTFLGWRLAGLPGALVVGSGLCNAMFTYAG